jgi:tetratricopeptide (TPR) repeat protein
VYKERIVRAEMENASQVMEQRARENFGEDISRAEGHHQRGCDYLANKEYAKAITEFDRALSLTPNNPKILREKARAQNAEKIEAIKVLTEAAVRRLDTGEWNEAKTEFQNILTTIPNESVTNSER